MSSLHVAGPEDVPRWTGNPWERQKGESRQAFEAFVVYRDLGAKRTMMGAAEIVAAAHGYDVATTEGKRNIRTRRRRFEAWGALWRWTKRIDLLEAHEDEIRREGAETAIREMSERHVAEALEMQRVAMMPAREIIRRIDAAELKLPDLDAMDLLRVSRLMTYAYSAASRVERLGRGVSDRGIDGIPDDGAAADAERERMAELHGEAVAQVIVLVLSSPELELPPDKQELARRLAGRHLRELAADAG